VSKPIDDDAGPSTRAVHGGVGRPDVHHAIPTPIVETATYTFANSAEVAAHMSGAHAQAREEYGRYGNPTVKSLENRLATLEAAGGGAECAAFSSGMAALTTAVLALVRHGSHVVLFRDGYRRTRQFVSRTLAAFGVEHTLVEPGDVDGVAKAITPKTRVVVGESPTNPYLHVTDLAALSRVCREAGRVKTIVDATFATPINCRPLSMGIDLVVHSATKYLAGHHDVLAGAVIGNPALVGLVRDLRGVLGGVLDPHAAFLVARGVKTLSLRVERQNATAMVVARALAQHPRVAQVFYPGLPSHPTHAVAKAQMSGFGGVVSFRVKVAANDDALAVTSRVVDAFRMARIAPSLGGVDTLVEQPAIMSYWELSPDERKEAGIHDDLIRLAVGVEDERDVLRDVMRALEAT